MIDMPHKNDVSHLHRELLASLDAAAFGASRYAWYRYGGPNRFIKSKKGKTMPLTKGTVFGVRPATSQKGMMRVVFEELGKHHVFSMSQASVDTLISKSKTHKAPVKMAAGMVKAGKNPALEALDSLLAIVSNEDVLRMRKSLEKMLDDRQALNDKISDLCSELMEEVDALAYDEDQARHPAQAARRALAQL